MAPCSTRRRPRRTSPGAQCAFPTRIARTPSPAAAAAPAVQRRGSSQSLYTGIRPCVSIHCCIAVSAACLVMRGGPSFRVVIDAQA